SGPNRISLSNPRAFRQSPRRRIVIRPMARTTAKTKNDQITVLGIVTRAMTAPEVTKHPLTTTPFRLTPSPISYPWYTYSDTKQQEWPQIIPPCALADVACYPFTGSIWSCFYFFPLARTLPFPVAESKSVTKKYVKSDSKSTATRQQFDSTILTPLPTSVIL